MQKAKKDIEILAPVGSYESLTASIQAGADAVYFGTGKLNMRSRSSFNFDFEDLEKISKICMQHNVKSYLTLNTVMYDNDIEELYKVIDAASKYNISAIIAMDMAVIMYAASKNVEVHSSTQLNISNIEALKFYSNYTDVIVLARELNLNQVKHITTEIERQQITGPSGQLIRIELFAHGALCMAISGKCYLSLHEQNHSANRGECFQTCRKGYIVTEKESGNQLEIDHEYIMSPKDLCTIGFLDKILDAGVEILKIEGRARSPEYVKTTVECYREAVDAVVEGTYTSKKITYWEDRLKSVFNRGFWDGYYLGQRLGEWSKSYGSKATRRKIYVGKCTNYFKNINVAEFKIETGNIQTGDEILIIGPTTGVIESDVSEIRKDDLQTDKAVKSDVISMPVKQFLRRSDKLYKLVK